MACPCARADPEPARYGRRPPGEGRPAAEGRPQFTETPTPSSHSSLSSPRFTSRPGWTSLSTVLRSRVATRWGPTRWCCPSHLLWPPCPCWGPCGGPDRAQAKLAASILLWGCMPLPSAVRRCAGWKSQRPGVTGAAWGLWAASLALGLTPSTPPPQNLLPAPVILSSVHELDLFR